MWRWLLGFVIVLLGTLWAFTEWRTGEIERTYPPTGEFVTVDGVRLHYEEAGTGQPLVLLHGAGANLHDWKASLFGDAAGEYRVIAFDRPGHGHSARPDEEGWDPRVQAALIHGALQKLGVEQPVLAGHSWSGALVLAYALAFPEDVEGIVVLSGVSHPFREGVRPSYRIAAMPVIGPVFRHTVMAPLGEALLPPSVKAAFAPNPPVEDYFDKAAVRLLFRPRAFLHNARDVIHLKAALTEMSRDYGKLSVPVLIISGMDDQWVDPENHACKLHRAAPDSRLVLIRNVGHMPHHIRPILIMDEIARLLRGETDDSPLLVVRLP
ncbi:MAG: alpha/beta fold hydrolase, partial [Alphaproteobacteria bacterium]